MDPQGNLGVPYLQLLTIMSNFRYPSAAHAQGFARSHQVSIEMNGIMSLCRLKCEWGIRQLRVEKLLYKAKYTGRQNYIVFS